MAEDGSGSVSGDPLAVPWRLEPSPGSCAVFAEAGDKRPAVVVARTHDLAEHVAALHNAELIRRKAQQDEAAAGKIV